MARNPALSSLRRLAQVVAFAFLAVAASSCVAAAPAHPTILVVGDSISAGYGLPAGQGWTALLAARLHERGYAGEVVNASISGDTTAGGRARLPGLLDQHHPSIVVIELGGNDGLRGGDLAATRANLDAMIVAAKHARAKVLLIGMQLPPNYGSAYTSRFAALYADAAKRHNVALVPFFFAGFADDDALFQADRIHPTLAAQPRLLDNVWPVLAPLLGKPR
jgi:acyl-CoA thioesterase-1